MLPLQPILIAAAVALVGVWLMLPPRNRWQWSLGGILAAVGAGLLAASLPGLGDRFAASVFWLLAGVAILGGIGTISTQNPVYSALWFALSLLGTAALFMVQGAQFLAAATIVVYAGAIVVTFLFVLMLAQPDGTAFYDRLGTGRVTSIVSAACGIAIVALLTATLAGLSYQPLPMTVATEKLLAAGVLHEEHVARLGGELFAGHLLAVEIAGVLLLVALVGASAMMLRSHGPTAAEANGHAGGDHE